MCGPPNITIPLEVLHPEIKQGLLKVLSPRPDPHTGLTWGVLQPIHRERPDDFYPWGIHGDQEHGLLLVAWGIWVCFSHKHTELAARIQDACQERRKTDPHHLMAGPSNLFTDAVLAQEIRSHQADRAP